MQKDLKIGMLLGMVLVTAVMLWLSIGPGLSPKARIQHLGNVATVQENSGSPNNRPTNSSAAIQPDSTIYEQAEMILDANRDEIEDVSKLKPGTKIIIPE